VRAWVTRHPNSELLRAAADLPSGPLHGWTFGVKDVIDTADLPTERGSPIYAGRATLNDASCVAMARQAGALITGKTATTEFALFTPTVTTNPHDALRTPGGSSSGSAAAVADGQVRAAFGTQTVGSVLRPAAYCGVVGFKPTHQLVPLTGVATLAQSFDTVGWFTTTVTDSSAVLAAMTGRTEPTLSGIGHAPSGRIGRYSSHQWSACEPAASAALDHAASIFDGGGFEVVDLDPFTHLDGVFEAADVVLHYEIARVFSWERAHHSDLISPLVQEMLRRADDIDVSKYRAAQARLDLARHEHGAAMGTLGLDALLTPSAPGEAPPLRTTGNSVFNRTWTALWTPAIHLPTGRGPQGLPVGVQLVGHAWGDDDLIALASGAEALLGTRR